MRREEVVKESGIQQWLLEVVFAERPVVMSERSRTEEQEVATMERIHEGHRAKATVERERHKTRKHGRSSIMSDQLANKYESNETS